MPSFMSEHNAWMTLQMCSGSLLNGATVWTSSALDITSFKYFGIAYYVAGSSPHVQFDMLGAISAADPLNTPLNTEFAIPNDASPIVSDASTAGWYLTSVQPPPASHLKIRASGSASNGSDTRITVKFFAKL